VVKNSVSESHRGELVVFVKWLKNIQNFSRIYMWSTPYIELLHNNVLLLERVSELL
jgi:hypothetical protein